MQHEVLLHTHATMPLLHSVCRT